MRIGNRFDIDCANITSLDGTSLPWVRELRYLGVLHMSTRKFKYSLEVGTCKDSVLSRSQCHIW